MNQSMDKCNRFQNVHRGTFGLPQGETKKSRLMNDVKCEAFVTELCDVIRQ
jgi:hypothetical protein